jgi:O-antigen/teichoic acid export membrane protein
VKNIGIKPNLQLSLKLDIKPFVKFMGIGHLSQLINFLNYRLDLWIMNYFIEPAQIGFYALAVGFANMITLITLPIVNVITPTLIEKNKVERMILFKSFSQFNFTLVLGASLLLFFIAPVILPFLYGKEFLPSVPLFRILLPGIVFASATKVLALISIAANQLKINLWATFFGLVFTVVFDFILIPKLGAVGASITSLITYFTIFIVLYILLVQKSLLNRQNYFIISVKTIRDLIPYLYARKH